MALALAQTGANVVLHGSREVEEFLDAVLSIQEHVDDVSRVKPRPSEPQPRRQAIRETAYDDLFYLGADRPPEPVVERVKVPAEPDRDVLLFVA